MPNNIKWKRLSRKDVYHSKFLSVYEDTVRLPNGKVIGPYTVTKKPDIVVIVATTKKKNELIVLNEYKYGADKIMRVLPAGHIETKEEALRAAKRELKEETGFSGGHFTYAGALHEYASKDLHTIHVVRAIGVTRSALPQKEETENISAHLLPISRVKKEIRGGRWQAASSLGALLIAGIY